MACCFLRFSLLAANALPGWAAALAMMPIPHNHCRRLIMSASARKAISNPKWPILQKSKVYNSIRKLSKHDDLSQQRHLALFSARELASMCRRLM